MVHPPCLILLCIEWFAFGHCIINNIRPPFYLNLSRALIMYVTMDMAWLPEKPVRSKLGVCT